VICPTCVGESAVGNKVRTCRDCLAESMFKRGMMVEKTAFKFCRCFAFGHDKEKLNGFEKKRLERVSGYAKKSK